MYRKILLILFLIIILSSAILLYKTNIRERENRKIYEDVFRQNEELMKNFDVSILKEKVEIKHKIIANITIPSIGISYPILGETTMDNLKIVPTKLCGPNANETGNFCIVGHNYKNFKQFSKIHNLENGDIVEITNLYRNKVQYIVYDKYEVKPTNTECLNQDTKGKREITLITCASNNKKRLVIKCKEAE